MSSVPIWMCRVQYLYQQPVFISVTLTTAYSCWTQGCSGDSTCQRLPAMQACVARCKFSVIGVLLVTWKVNLVVSFSCEPLWRDCFLWGCEVAEILFSKKIGIMPIFWFMLSKDLFQRNLGKLRCLLLRLGFKALYRNIWKKPRRTMDKRLKSFLNETYLSLVRWNAQI